MVINVGGVVSSRAAAPGAALAAKDGSGHVDGRQFGDMLEKLANASAGPSSDRPAAKADSAKPSTAAAAPEPVSVAAAPDTVSASVTDMAALAASVPADAGPATCVPAAAVPVKAAGQRDSQADKPAAVTDPQPADSVPTLAILLGISIAVPLQDVAPATPPAGTADEASSAAVDGGVSVGGTAIPIIGANAGFGRMAHALARAVASTGAASPAVSPDPAGVPTAVSVPVALGATTLADPSTTASPVTTTPSTAAAVATATNPVAGAGVPAKPDVLGTTQTMARGTVPQPGPASAQLAVASQDAPAVAAGAGPQMAGAGAPPVLSASVHATQPGSAAGTGKLVPGPQTAPAAVQAPSVVDVTTAAVLGSTTPAPALGGSGDAKPDGRSRGSLAGDAGGAPAAKAAVASGIFDPQMRLAADLPAVDHVVGVRQAAASTAGQASGATLDAEVPHQIVQAIRLQWTQGVGTARVTLQPDYLGDLRIDIRVDRGAVTAVLDASNPAVRQWIEGHESTLRQGLAEQGLTLDRLVVKDEQTPPDAGAEQRRQPRDEQPPEPRRRPAAAPTDATFEVVM